MKLYRVSRGSAGDILVCVLEGRSLLHAKLEDGYRLPHVVVNSTGFETGYGGSGPADLALAILIDHFAEPPTARRDLRLGPIPGADPQGRAYRLHQEFKWDVIAGQQLRPGEHYDIDTAFIEEWLGRKGKTSWSEAIAGGLALVLALLPWMLVW